MDIGSLRHFVTIQAPIGVLSDSTAVDVDTSVPMAFAVVPLAFQPRESLALGGLQTQTLYTATCRYREDVRPAYVLREECCTQRVFQILAIIPGGKRDSLDMTCVTNG
jgi:hypothetical protein